MFIALALSNWDELHFDKLYSISEAIILQTTEIIE